MAKRFFYVCAGLFLLALSYHLGAGSAVAQAPANPIVGMASPTNGSVTVVTADGTVYGNLGSYNTPFSIVGQVFGGAVSTTPRTIGSLKARYRDPQPQTNR